MSDGELPVGEVPVGELSRGHRIKEQLFHNGIDCFQRLDQLSGMVTTTTATTLSLSSVATTTTCTSAISGQTETSDYLNVCLFVKFNAGAFN